MLAALYKWQHFFIWLVKKKSKPSLPSYLDQIGLIRISRCDNMVCNIYLLKQKAKIIVFNLLVLNKSIPQS